MTATPLPCPYYACCFGLRDQVMPTLSSGSLTVTSFKVDEIVPLCTELNLETPKQSLKVEVGNSGPRSPLSCRVYLQP